MMLPAFICNFPLHHSILDNLFTTWLVTVNTSCAGDKMTNIDLMTSEGRYK